MAAPLIINNAPQGHWECNTCCDTYVSPPQQPLQTHTGEFVCSDCITSLFQLAVKYDHHWPAKWGNIVLRIEDFESTLEPEMLAGLLWKRTALETEAERLAGLEPAGLKGQERGVDYQYCPACQVPIGLIDGYNHVVCDCHQNFCFKCGQPAREGSGHWTRKGCPRFGNAIYDEGEPEGLVVDYDSDYSDGLGPLTSTQWKEHMIENASYFTLRTWAWNVAMQNSNHRLHAHMRAFFLGVSDGRPARQHWNAVVHAMQAYSPLHGITRQKCIDVLNEHAETHLGLWHSDFEMPYHDFLYPAGGEQPTGLAWGRLLTMCRYLDELRTDNDTLQCPLGVFFDLSFDRGRRAAVRWILDRANREESDSDSIDWLRAENHAILACGPSGHSASRMIGAEILASLHGRDGRTALWFPFRERSVTFEQLSGATFVHVSDEEVNEDHENRRGRMHRLAAIADESLDPEMQDNRLASWLDVLFTQLEVFAQFREAHAEIDDWHRRPGTLLLEDRDSDDESDDGEMLDESDDGVLLDSDQDVEMADGDEDDGDSLSQPSVD